MPAVCRLDVTHRQEKVSDLPLHQPVQKGHRLRLGSPRFTSAWQRPALLARYRREQRSSSHINHCEREPLGP